MRHALFASALALAVSGFLACASDDAPEAISRADGGPVSPDAGPPTDADGDGGADAGNGPAPVFFKSGARLKIESMRAEGRAYFRRFIDTKLGTPCTLTQTSETTAICLPATAPYTYADADCTTGVALAPTCAPDTKYTFTATSSCNYLSDVVLYPLGPAIPGTTFYQGATCDATPTAEGSLLSLGAPIPQNELVSFTSKREAATPELDRVRWIGDDGTELVDSYALFDTKRDKACSAASIGLVDAGGSIRCVSRRRAIHRGGGDGPFSDATCTTPAADFAVALDCASPEIVFRRNAVADVVDGSCDPRFYISLHALGPQAASTFQKVGSCTPQAPSPPRTTWELGAPIPATDFVELTRPLFGAGRIRELAFASGGMQVVPGGTIDTLSGGSCFETKIGADLYCVTELHQIGTQNTFEDTACTKPVILGTTCSPVKPQAAAAYVPNGDGCGHTIEEVHALVPLAITTVYRESNGTCDPEPLQAKAYGIGGVVDPATLFPKVEVVTE